MPLGPQITSITEVANKEILSSYDEGIVARGCIIVANTADIVPGRVLGRVTASGKYTIYNPAAGDGSQVAVAIAANFAKQNAAQDQQIHMYLRGNFKLDQLVGLDAAAVTALGGRQDSANNLFAN